jgi:hypothetical protein
LWLISVSLAVMTIFLGEAIRLAHASASKLDAFACNRQGRCICINRF